MRWFRAGAALATSVVAVVSLGARADAASVPYSDAKVNGYLGLCDASGHAVHAGSLDDRPFVGTAVSSTAAPADYAGDGRTATLFAFQPRPGVAPGEWSGDALGASTRYTNPAHPIGKLVAADAPLREFVDSYPPRWNGLLQLRLYLGAPDQPPYTQTYAATDIRVSGSRWEVVRGGDVACDVGQATSIAELLPSADPSKSVAQAIQEQQATSTTLPGLTTGQLAAPTTKADTARPAPSRTRHGVPWALLAVPAVLGAAFIARRRRRTPFLHSRHR